MAARLTPWFRASIKLKIVGVADLDPESMRGPTRARVFLPLKLAESLHVMQPTDLREISRAGR